MSGPGNGLFFMHKDLKIFQKNVTDLIPYVNNPRNNAAAVDAVASSIAEFGFNVPIVLDKNNIIVTGHTRLLAAKKLGLESVPCIIADHLTDAQIKAFRLADNRVAELATWDEELLQAELQQLSEMGIDMGDFGFTEEELEKLSELKDVEEDAAPAPEVETATEPQTRPGDIYDLGGSRLMCGDSTREEDVSRLTDGVKVDLVFTDPPYGMGKEAEGILNDNLNYAKLLEFNKRWIPLSMDALKDNGSWYCWGTDEPLMDIYANIIKPLIAENKATFRNLITWDKGQAQGQNSEAYRMYPIGDEKCLFIMLGVQGFNTNADNYFEGWEPVRNYLLESRLAMGWDVPAMKRIVGHSDISRDHWTGKSQFNLPTAEVYNALKAEAERQRKEKGLTNDAFKREYDDLKREYYSTRAYFNNTHDLMTNVWHFPRTSAEERELTGGHASPKPLALCARAIKSSSREGETVLDLFGGSGSTLIACEQLNRRCFTMELDPRYCDVIIKRWETLTGKKAVKL